MNRHSVEYGMSLDYGLGNNKAFPFMYSFVNFEDDTWEANKATNTMDSIGPLVPAGRTVEHPIRLSPDYNYKMLWLRYCAYHNYGGSGTYIWYEPFLAGGFLEQGDYQTAIGTPLIWSIRVSVSMHGPDGRYLYGGKNLNNMINAQGDLLGPRVTALQGYDFGWGQIRTEYLLPRNGIIKLRIQNLHAIKDLYVAGMIYGMKVRI